MSRIGKKPVDLPSGVTASVSGQTIEVKGPKGTRSFKATDDVTLAVEDNVVTITPRGKSKRARQQWGMSRTMVSNLVAGVTEGFKKELEIQGVGYRAAMNGNTLKLNLGLSHDVDYVAPEGVTVTAPKQTEIVVEGIDEQLVGQVAATIRAAIRVSSSSAKKARRSKDRTDGKQQKTTVSETPPARSEQTSPGQRRASSPLRSPLEQKHQRPADRRRKRGHIGFRVLDGKRLGRCWQEQHRSSDQGWFGNRRACQEGRCKRSIF